MSSSMFADEVPRTRAGRHHEMSVADRLRAEGLLPGEGGEPKRLPAETVAAFVKVATPFSLTTKPSDGRPPTLREDCSDEDLVGIYKSRLLEPGLATVDVAFAKSFDHVVFGLRDAFRAGNQTPELRSAIEAGCQLDSRLSGGQSIPNAFQQNRTEAKKLAAGLTYLKPSESEFHGRLPTARDIDRIKGVLHNVCGLDP